MLGKLPLASGGPLETGQMFFRLISFKFRADGTWYYKKNENEEEFCTVVPLVDGSFAQINHLGVHESTKMLGSMTCPSRCNKGAIKYMLTKSRAWRDTIKAGKLSRRYVWFMMKKQFCPRVAYGLCTILALYKVLLECLIGTYCKIHLQGGVRQLARRGIQQLEVGFYGVGCPHPAIECFIAQLNKLPMHYQNQSCLGL
jgi:hypothetical protein